MHITLFSNSNNNNNKNPTNRVNLWKFMIRNEGSERQRSMAPSNDRKRKHVHFAFSWALHPNNWKSKFRSNSKVLTGLANQKPFTWHSPTWSLSLHLAEPLLKILKNEFLHRRLRVGSVGFLSSPVLLFKTSVSLPSFQPLPPCTIVSQSPRNWHG